MYVCNVVCVLASADINGEIGFSFTPMSLQFGEPLQADCVVITQSDLQNPQADITWLGPDGSIFGSMQDVPFSEVTRGGFTFQEARLPFRFPSFEENNVGEYSCLASITSDNVPGAQTSVFRSVQIPTISELPHTHIRTHTCSTASRGGSL